MSKRDDFVAGAAEQAVNGSIYVRGAQGQTGSQITEAWVRIREHGVTKEIVRVLKLLAARIKAGFTALRAFDCSGLVMWLLEQLGFKFSDHSADSIYFGMCVAIGKYDLAPGDLVFKKYATKNQMYHVGIYMGDGTVVHAKGRDYGVVRDALSKGGWNRFGRLKCLPAGIVTCLLRTLKIGYKGGDVYALELALESLGYDCNISETEKSTGIGEWGPACEDSFRKWQAKHPECGGKNRRPDGECGPKSAAALGLNWAG